MVREHYIPRVIYIYIYTSAFYKQKVLVKTHLRGRGLKEKTMGQPHRKEHYAHLYKPNPRYHTKGNKLRIR